MIEVLDGMDLSGVPIPFLEAFPFPAFVLVIPNTTIRGASYHNGSPPELERPRLRSTDTDTTIRPPDSPLIIPPSPFSLTSTHQRGPSLTSLSAVTSSTIVWSNEKWLRTTEGRPLRDCLGDAGLPKLQDWIEGVGSLVEQKLFTLEIKEPILHLDLSRTILPLSPASASHHFCIVTSQPRPGRPTSTFNISGFTTDPSTPNEASPSAPPRRKASRDSGLRTSFPPLLESPESEDGPEALTPTPTRTPPVGEEGGSLTPALEKPGSQAGSSSMSKQDSRSRVKSKRGQPPPPVPTVRPMVTSSDRHWRMVEEYDWASTKLGPRENWKSVADPLISVAFQSNAMECIWLGQDLQLIYNNGYAGLVDHPKSFGRPGREVWVAIWDYVEPLLHKALNGSPVHCDNDLLLFKKFGPGILLEFYCSWRYVPIAGRNGEVMGVYNQALETTDQVLAERRLNTARDLSEQLLLARSVKEYFSFMAEVLETNPKDVPFGMFYSVKSADYPPKDPTATAAVAELTLESTIGVPQGHPSASETLTFHIPVKSRFAFGPNAGRLSSPTMSAISAISSGSGRRVHIAEEPSWPILKALSTRQCVLVEDCRELIKGYPIRHWDELPMSALVVPICSENAVEVPGAVMVLGLNLRRPFDSDYDGWLHEIRTQLATTLVSVKGFEMEQRRIDEALKMEKAKAAWFRGAAHDLRSPLTLVRGPIEDLLDSKLSNSQRNQLEIAKRNVDRLLRLVNALMDFSRLEAGRVQGRFVPIDLGKYVDDIATLFRPALERLKIKYVVQIQPYDHMVFVDPTLLETVLSNLISNALKYTEKGSVTVRLTFGEDAEIAIIDTGIGIPRGEVEHVAEWFHRASSAVHAGTTGTGLGLALARELLRLHGGDLRVTSRAASEDPEDHGSTFVARIPLTTKIGAEDDNLVAPFGQYGKSIANEALSWIRGERDRSDGDSSEQGSDTQGSTTTGSGTTKLGDGLSFEKDDVLMIVDDSVDIRDYLRRIFTPFCRVVEAGTGEQALTMALEHPPTLILSDIMIPKMSGTELLTALRTKLTRTFIPFILLSAMTGEEARVDALLAGADDYLEKPFKPKELVARVHLHMQIGKKRNTLEGLFAEREAETRFMSEYCPSGLVRNDAQGRSIYANQAFRTLSGMPIEADATYWEEYCSPDVIPYITEKWQAFIQGDETDLRMSWRWANGTFVSGVFVRLDLLQPGMTGIIGVMTDITHEEQRIIEAEQRRVEAEESKHQQELLIDLTSHEIRTPVSAILQCSSLVKENLVALKDQLNWSGQRGFIPTRELLEDLEDDVEALESIYQCGLVQERIAGDILSLARIQLDMLSLHHIDMDIRKEGRKVLSVFSSEARMKQIQLALEFGSSLDKSGISGIKTDPVRLGQVVTNLTSNAIRFTASSPIRKITVSYDISFLPPALDSCAVPRSTGLPEILPPPEDTPVWLFVSIRDTGPGLPPNELAQLFKRFSQGNAMIHTRYGGSGLGLFICKKITEMLGGRVEVLSTVGEGSVFRFFIQTRTIDPKPPLPPLVSNDSTGSISSVSSGSSTASARSDMAGMSNSGSPAPSVLSSASSPPSGIGIGGIGAEPLHILIVEDNVINQTVLKRQIVKAGLTCDVANNGLEALNLVREADRQAKRGGQRKKKPYSVILMDLEMPVMDGLSALREIRAAEAAGTLERNVVMALTGNARQGQIDQALAAGMDDVVIKPYVLNDLLRKIQLMWGRKADAVASAASLAAAAEKMVETEGSEPR